MSEAVNDYGYARNPTDGFTMKERWLSEIRDDVKLREIALPGTHNSGAFDVCQRPGPSLLSTSIAQGTPLLASTIRNTVAKPGFNSAFPWLTAKSLRTIIPTLALSAISYLIELGFNAVFNDALTTQALNFQDQLNYGIRVLEIQVCHVKDALILSVGYSHLGMGFDTVLDQVQLFLTNNPTETVLINLCESKRIEPSGNKHRLDEILDAYLNSGTLRDLYLKPNDLDITLGEARGKFILMSWETKFSPVTLKLNTHGGSINSIIMDKTYLKTNWDLYWEKWIPVKSHLLETVDSCEDKIFIAYLNGWGGSFPYFVASGHSSPQTGAPRLATGLTTPGWASSYPDFPRVCRFLGMSTIAFEGINNLTRDLIRKINKERHNRTVGIVLIDFPGNGLIRTIISNNHPLIKDNRWFRL